MIIDRAHIRWGLLTLLASAGVTVLYLANNYPDKLPVHIPLPAWLGHSPPLRANPGATRLGLIYGTLALLIFIFAALLGWRRNHPSLKVGRIQVWLKAHIWLTVFTIPLVLLHCGFHGGGPMTRFLMWLYLVVMLSGFWGLALQHIVPKLMRDYLPAEVIFDEIPFIRGQLVAQAQVVLEKLSEPFADADAGPAKTETGAAATLIATRTESVMSLVRFLDEDALPYLQASSPRRFRLRHQPMSDDLFRLLKSQTPASRHAFVDQVQALCDEKRRLDFQQRLHRWLHGWLLLHAPASILLVVLTIWHAIVAVFTYA